jgi:hypothetical protein
MGESKCIAFWRGGIKKLKNTTRVFCSLSVHRILATVKLSPKKQSCQRSMTMMALLFLITTAGFGAILFKKENLAIWLYWVATILGCVILMHHIDFGSLNISL